MSDSYADLLKHEPSEGMKKMYREKREKTCQKVRDAIDTIEKFGRRVTKKEIMEITGLSSATLSKEYVKEIFRERGVCQFRKFKTVQNPDGEARTVELLLKENKELKRDKKNLEDLTEYYEKKFQKLDTGYAEATEELKRLKGKYQQALEYLELLGADLKKLPIY